MDNSQVSQGSPTPFESNQEQQPQNQQQLEYLQLPIRPSPICVKSLDLFAQNGVTAVQGTFDDMTRLSADINMQSIYVQAQSFHDPADAIKLISRYIRQKSDLPDEGEAIMPVTWPSKQRKESVRQANLAVAKNGMINPPFETLNISRILQALGDEAPFLISFHLGVVTSVSGNGIDPCHTTVWFDNGKPDDTKNITIWIYRVCHMDEAGSYREEWHPFGDEGLMGNTTDSFWSKNSTQERLLRGDLAHLLTSGSILDAGTDIIGQSAEVISGDVILALAENHGNGEMFHRMNKTLRAENLRRISQPNVITRRITLAIERQARKRGVDKHVVRDELNQRRASNRTRDNSRRVTIENQTLLGQQGLR